MLQGGSNCRQALFDVPASLHKVHMYNKIEALRFRVRSSIIHFVQSYSKNILMNSIINGRWQRFERSLHSVRLLFDFSRYVQIYFRLNIESCVWPGMCMTVGASPKKNNV